MYCFFPPTGVLWSGSKLIGQANTALNKFRELGKKVFYVTNNSTKSRDEYMEKCDKLGFIAKKVQCFNIMIKIKGGLFNSFNFENEGL